MGMIYCSYPFPFLKGVINVGKNLRGKEIGKGISQRKNGSYHARYIDRFGNRKSIYSNDLQDIKKRLADLEYENRYGLTVIDDKMTLDEWYKNWMNVYKAPNIRANTKRHYATIYTKHISPVLGSMRLLDIGKIHIQNLINGLEKEGLQWETQNKVRVLLGDMFNCALVDQYVNRNPCKGVKCVSKRSDNEPRFLTKTEQALFFECCAGRWYDNLFNVAINTGLRPGELAALTWDNIDLNKMIIRVEHTLVYQKFEGDTKKVFHLEDTKTSKSNRTVPINDQCLKYLKRQFIQKNIISRQKKSTSIYDDCLFVNRRNNPINATDFTHAINEVLRDINELLDPLEQIESFSGHTFRHTFATRCIESGIRPKTLQMLLGHTNLKTTMDMYVHVDDESKQEQMELLENNFSPWDNINQVYERERKIVNFR